MGIRYPKRYPKRIGIRYPIRYPIRFDLVFTPSRAPKKKFKKSENTVDNQKGGKRFYNRSADTVGLENPWSQAGTPEPWTWAQIKQWALDHVHHSDRHNWLRVARRAFDRQDGAKLGIMVLGS